MRRAVLLYQEMQNAQAIAIWIVSKWMDTGEQNGDEIRHTQKRI